MLFDHFKKYSKILVTGPHRSGTTICAKMIAHDTGYKFLDEKEFEYRFIREIPNVWEVGTVLQAPNALPWIHVLANDPTALVVIMKRPVKEIQESVKRQVDKKGKPVTPPVYTAQQGYLLLTMTKDNHSDHWDDINTVEISYSDLSKHKLWVPKHERKNWHYKTTANK